MELPFVKAVDDDADAEADVDVDCFVPTTANVVATAAPPLLFEANSDCDTLLWLLLLFTLLTWPKVLLVIIVKSVIVIITFAFNSTTLLNGVAAELGPHHRRQLSSCNGIN